MVKVLLLLGRASWLVWPARWRWMREAGALFVNIPDSFLHLISPVGDVGWTFLHLLHHLLDSICQHFLEVQLLLLYGVLVLVFHLLLELPRAHLREQLSHCGHTFRSFLEVGW